MEKGTLYLFTGLSGAGKTTVGKLLYEKIRAEKPNVFFLDSDAGRVVFNDKCGYSREERLEGAYRNARVCKMLADQGIDVVCCTISMFDGVREWNREHIPGYCEIYLDVPMDVLRELSTFFAHITDYKSHFTWQHSLGIAEKAERMGEFYGYSRQMCDMMFIAGALHDIGKLLIPNDILEKPGRLTQEEYREIQNHALGTWELLKDIGGMEDIARWASLHHEKLDGSGYPFGYKAEQLGKNERVMACLDIYQALVEERPYKASLHHEEAMAILQKMGDAGHLDRQIIQDIDHCHAIHCEAGQVRRQREDEVCPQYDGEAWRCPVCGYVYEGELPSDFICPRCEQPGTIFERVSDS